MRDSDLVFFQTTTSKHSLEKKYFLLISLDTRKNRSFNLLTRKMVAEENTTLTKCIWYYYKTIFMYV